MKTQTNNGGTPTMANETKGTNMPRIHTKMTPKTIGDLKREMEAIVEKYGYAGALSCLGAMALRASNDSDNTPDAFNWAHIAEMLYPLFSDEYSAMGLLIKAQKEESQDLMGAWMFR